MVRFKLKGFIWPIVEEFDFVEKNHEKQTGR